MPNVMKSGSINLLEPSGPHRACYRTPLPSFLFLFYSVQCLFHLPYAVLTSFIKSMSMEQDLLPFLHEDNCIRFSLILNNIVA